VRVLITGADGFIGKNLRQHLAEQKDIEVLAFGRQDDPLTFSQILDEVDFVFHLAGVNRPQDPQEFQSGNAGVTQSLCVAVAEIAQKRGRKIPVVYASSVQAAQANPYGQSKKVAEDALFALQRERGAAVYVFRLPNVFGKWCKPNYNSVVATFCHNLTRGLPIMVNDPQVQLQLVYIDDVVNAFLGLLHSNALVGNTGFVDIAPVHSITVGELARTLQTFVDSRATLLTPPVGQGLMRALYSTYISYLGPDSFAYTVPAHTDARGVFVEMLKTPDCGQFSFFTAHPGFTRGGHYHHSKTEKFLVIKGRARFKFRHMQTGQTHELITTGDRPEVVDTVPGWTHDITNIGDSEMVVMLWANEIFDRDHPDTVSCPV
jgi:UDP-2-acetamido-2,6-beta-L-arabino-hexul-4-ose reductase